MLLTGEQVKLVKKLGEVMSDLDSEYDSSEIFKRFMQDLDLDNSSWYSVESNIKELLEIYKDEETYEKSIYGNGEGNSEEEYEEGNDEE